MHEVVIFTKSVKIDSYFYYVSNDQEEKEQLNTQFLEIPEAVWHVAERLINSEGNCICEDCMAIDFREKVLSNPIQQSLRTLKLLMCYICRDVVTLDFLGGHIATKHGEAPRSDGNTGSFKCK